MDRMIGILGGMGPEATLDLYRWIVRLTPARTDQEHIRTLIYSNPRIPDRTRAILGTGPTPLPELIRSARLLEQGGAGVITIPCNASHYYLPEIAREITVPIINMIEETCRKIRRELPSAETVGVLAATGTVHARVYNRALESSNLRMLAPDDSEQQEVHRAIMEIKAGSSAPGIRDRLHTAGMRLMERGAEAVILGCTEIPLALDPAQTDYPAFDTTRILAEAAVNWALGTSGDCGATRRQPRK